MSCPKDNTPQVRIEASQTSLPYCIVPCPVPSEVRTPCPAFTAEMAKGATVIDWENNVLKEGENGWICFPAPPQIETGPCASTSRGSRGPTAGLTRRK